MMREILQGFKEAGQEVLGKALKEALRKVPRKALKILLRNCFHAQRVKTNTYRKGL